MLELLQLAMPCIGSMGPEQAEAQMMALHIKGVVSKVIGLKGKKIFFKFDFRLDFFKANLLNLLPYYF